MTSFVNVAIEGCCHGELDKIYQAIAENERRTRTKVDLLLVCGDFECVRDILDLECLAVPTKYRKLNSFHQYVTGEKVAPVTTIFVGGNHEASNVLQSLYYGGWVAPKIYFMGFAGVVNFRGLRIGGLSGIFYQKHYRMGHFETPPYTEDTLRSVYHMRELEVYRMAHMIQSDRPVDILLSHDWPAGIWDYGNRDRLLRTKPYFREDMQSGKLGNPPLMHLLMTIKPRFWFSAHLHVKFGATIQHAPYPVPAQATAYDHMTSNATHTIDSAAQDNAQHAESAQYNEANNAGAEGSASEDPDELDISDLQDLIDSSKQRISAQSTTTAQGLTSPRSADSSGSLSELGKRSASARSPQHAPDAAGPKAEATVAGAAVDLHYGIATHFLALDKVLPGREFLQIMQIPVPAATSTTERSQELEFDVEWLAVLRRTHNLLQTHRGVVQLPQQVDKITAQEIAETHGMVLNDFHSLQIPAIGPCTPTLIAGQCTPFPQSVPGRSVSSGYDTSGSTEYLSASGASTDQGHIMYATTEHSSSYGSGEGSTGEQSDSRSSLSQLQYTQESYAHHQQQQHMQQRDHYGGGRGRGRGRGRNQSQQGNSGFNSSIYGPGGGRGGGRGGASNHSSGSSMLFNPTSRVTPLGNAQTDQLLQALGLLHIWTRPCEYVEATPDMAHAKAGTGFGTGTADSTAQRGRGVRPPLPPGPPPVQSQSAGTVSQDMGSLNLLPGSKITGAVGTAPRMAAGKDDKYGLHAYYGNQATYVMQADDSPTVTGSSAAEDPSELNIEDTEEPVVNVDKASVDPNMIDLDF